MNKVYARIYEALTVSRREFLDPKKALVLAVAEAANVSRATVYRYLKNYPLLREMFAAVNPPRQALSRLNRPLGDRDDGSAAVVAQLRQEIRDLKAAWEKSDKEKNAQIMLLWLERKRLVSLLQDQGVDSSTPIIQICK